VITAVTAQNTVGVRAIGTIAPELVGAQIDAVLDDIGADAIKIGMLATAPIAAMVAERLRHWLPRCGDPPVVLDPVMVAKSGDPLLSDDAAAALERDLLPLATLVTPNLPEAERLGGADRLAERATAVLLKGGHAEGPEIADVLIVGGEIVRRFVHPRLPTRSTHGTGCTLSSAIAAFLGRGADLESAVEQGIAYLQAALAAAYPLGAGHGPVNHLHAWPIPSTSS
jgi:hydroxymethylpyrimidine/phosphomethylpyrimidine kinase